jgi:RND family efflux transporter MFP subunit
MANLEDLRIDSPIPKPRRRAKSPMPVLLIVLIAAAAAYWLLGDRIEQVKAKLAPARQVEIYKIPSHAAGPAGSFTAGGYIEIIPPGPTVVASMIDGKIVSLSAKPGDRVSPGQVIARLDGSLLAQDVAVQRSRVDVAQANVARMEAGFRTEDIARAEAELGQAQSRQAKSEADLARFKQLYDEGIVSASEYDRYVADAQQARGDVQARQSALDLLRAGQRKEDIAIAQRELNAARAELSRAQTLMGKTVIKCPASGVVLDMAALPGSWVSIGDRERAGEICRIFDPSRLQAWVDVNQRDIANVYVGQKVSLTTDVRPDDAIGGHVTQLMPNANIQKNTVQVKVGFDKPHDFLRPEMSAQVTFIPREADGDVAAPKGVDVPGSAVLSKGSASYVFVVTDGKAARREVQLGTTSGDKVRILSGVGSGDAVVVNPAGVAEGQAVKTGETPTSEAK